MNTTRMPVSVIASAAAHAAFLVLFAAHAVQDKKQVQQIVDGVDLLIAPAAQKPVAAVPKPNLSTMDFLKMALPAAPPHRAEIQAVDLKLPESRKPKLAEAPKLEDSTRKAAAKLDALDLSRSRAVTAADLTAEPVSRRRAAETLAALPKLEDVGRRRVKNLPEALALEDKRREATAVLGGPLSAPAPTSRRQALAAAAVPLEDAAGAPAAAPKRGLTSLLPDAIELKPHGVTAAAAPKLAPIAEEPKLVRRQAAAAEGGAKKGIEIEGPLKDRRVTHSAVPVFPDWAKAQGMMEAEVAIRFNVGPEGAVLPGMKVERTSGYGRLDRLVMDSLREWTWEAKPGSGAQWGVITFRFVLE